MHGRLKVKTSEVQAEEKRKEREAKGNIFKAGTNRLLQKRADGELDDEALALSGQLLAANPDVSTFWNYRREVLLRYKDQSETFSRKISDGEGTEETEKEDERQHHEEQLDGEVDGKGLDGQKAKNPNGLETFQSLCCRELELTAVCLMKNVKSYCSWHQRGWILQLMPEPDLVKEVSLCNRFLDQDERNFHCWDHRRFVRELAKTKIEDEIGFTLQKIEQNFSNFSSWYYRSSLFTEADIRGIVDFAKEWEKEYLLVQNAIFTDPSDQSAWFYHKWLTATDFGTKIREFAQRHDNGLELVQMILDSKHLTLICCLSQTLTSCPISEVTFKSNDSKGLNASASCWQSVHEGASNIWVLPVPATGFDKLEMKSTNALQFDTLELSVPSNHREVVVFKRERVYNSTSIKLNLKDQQLDELKCLQEMEPNNKWINLTLALINSENQVDILNKLVEIDPLRRNYYRDQRSKVLTERKLENVTASDVHLNLADLSLTSLFFPERLVHIRFLDLSHNLLTQIGKSFNALLCLEVLVLDYNRVAVINKGFEIKSLEVLSLRRNRISDGQCLENLKNCVGLKTVLIEGNALPEKAFGEAGPKTLAVNFACGQDETIDNLRKRYCGKNVVALLDL